MECSKAEFLSVVDPWRGKECLLVVLTEDLNLHLSARLESLSTGAVLFFSGLPGESLRVDLARADFFEFGDARLVPEGTREDVNLLFEAAVCARVTNELMVGILLKRQGKPL